MTEPPESQPPDQDDEFVLALARRARAPQWEELAHGRMSLAEAQHERTIAGDSADSIERASAYFQPFDADEQASLVDSLLVSVAQPEAPTAEVIPLRPRRVFLATAIAIAAAVSLWWFWPRDLGPGSGQLAHVELPGYSLETEGGRKQIRDSSSEPEASLHYRDDSKFEWVLRPNTAVVGAVDVRGFAFTDPTGAGRVLDLGELAQIGESGSIRIRGTIGQLGLDVGEATIVLVVGRPGELPEGRGFAELEQGGWKVARIEVVVED